MINFILSLLYSRKKIYIFVNNKECSKGKLARACATIGQKAPHMRFSKIIILKGGDNYLNLLDLAKKEKYVTKFIGEHIDAGLTQVEPGTSLAFGVSCFERTKLEGKLY